MTLGAVVISRNDGYGGDQPLKALHCLNSLLAAMDEVIYVDWNSPCDISLFDEIGTWLPQTGKLRALRVTEAQARELTHDNPNAQLCVEVLARNIGLRRLRSDYLISCNADIMVLGRESIERGIRNDRTFHCIARRETPFQKLSVAVPGSEQMNTLMAERLAEFGQHGGGSPLGAADTWSLITCPGDFQLAHRQVWHGIRGFEESLIARGYADSNVQRKADFYGYDLVLVREIPVFHFEHYPDTGASGGTTNLAWNDADVALWKFNGTTNPESWGFADRVFEEETL